MSNHENRPANYAKAVTPSDTNDVMGQTLSRSSVYCRALYIGTTGNIALVCQDSNFKDSPESVSFLNVPVGVLPVKAVQVLSTGTTASDIVALF